MMLQHLASRFHILEIRPLFDDISYVMHVFDYSAAQMAKPSTMLGKQQSRQIPGIREGMMKCTQTYHAAFLWAGPLY